MRPSQVEYYRPASLTEAIQLLSSHDNAKALAGGHSLIPAMNLRLAQPEVLVDLRELNEMRGITLSGDKLRIGALCTHAEVAASELVRTHCPALASAAGEIGDVQVRNWGTLGGNLAYADPAADLPPAVLGCDATLYTVGREGERAIKADEFFIDLFMVDLMPGELLVAVEIPSLASKRSAYVKFPHPASHYALVGVCVALDVQGGQCVSARVAVGGSLPRATRSPGAEGMLTGSILDASAIDAAANALLDEVSASVMGDMFAPEDYRRSMIQVYFKRAVRAALA